MLNVDVARNNTNDQYQVILNIYALFESLYIFFFFNLFSQLIAMVAVIQSDLSMQLKILFTFSTLPDPLRSYSKNIYDS